MLHDSYQWCQQGGDWDTLPNVGLQAVEGAPKLEKYFQR